MGPGHTRSSTRTHDPVPGRVVALFGGRSVSRFGGHDPAHDAASGRSVSVSQPVRLRLYVRERLTYRLGRVRRPRIKAGWRW